MGKLFLWTKYWWWWRGKKSLDWREIKTVMGNQTCWNISKVYFYVWNNIEEMWIPAATYMPPRYQSDKIKFVFLFTCLFTCGQQNEIKVCRCIRTFPCDNRKPLELIRKVFEWFSLWYHIAKRYSYRIREHHKHHVILKKLLNYILCLTFTIYRTANSEC